MGLGESLNLTNLSSHRVSVTISSFIHKHNTPDLRRVGFLTRQQSILQHLVDVLQSNSIMTPTGVNADLAREGLSPTRLPPIADTGHKRRRSPCYTRLQAITTGSHNTPHATPWIQLFARTAHRTQGHVYWFTKQYRHDKEHRWTARWRDT